MGNQTIGRHPLRLTESSNAERLVDMHGADIRYCPPMNAWYVWGGRKWHEDTSKELYRMAQEVARAYHTTATELDPSDLNRNRLLKHAALSESLRGVRNMIELAQATDGICVDVVEFDRDPMLLNVENGTIDLNTLKFRKFDQYDYITKLAPVQYTKGVKSEAWGRFLADVIPNKDTRTFLQTAVGYSLTADMSEDKMFMLHGRGRNGKTTFVSAILNMLGDYASQAASSMLMSKRDGGPSNEIFVLMGKRFVAATETSESHTLNENLIKQMAGMDRVSVNPKYRSQMEFVPTWKMWLSTNHEPTIVGTDEAIWRRMLKIPFEVTIADDQCDTKLKPYLMYNREERSGILNWALKGLRRWKSEGLVIPRSIYSSTRRYRADQDFTGQFIADCCKIHPNVTVTKRELYASYASYCHHFNEEPKSIRGFGLQLKEREIRENRSANKRFWKGIGLRNSVSLSPLDFE